MSKHTFLLLLLSISVIFGCQSPTESDNQPDKEEWIPLFNGKDLSAWTPKFNGHPSGHNFKNTFQVNDSLLQVRYREQDTFHAQFGHLFYQQEFSHYRLRARYRFVGEQLKGGPGWAFRNNGLMLHCEAPEAMAVDQEFPLSLEMQLLGGNGEQERSTGNLCTPDSHVHLDDTLTTAHCISSNSATYHGDQWVKAEALVLGDSLIQHYIEDKLVFSFTRPIIDRPGSPQNGKPLDKGYVSIQAETHPIDFRSIELLDLCGCMDKKAKNHKSYFVKKDNSKCVY